MSSVLAELCSGDEKERTEEEGWGGRVFTRIVMAMLCLTHIHIHTRRCIQRWRPHAASLVRWKDRRRRLQVPRGAPKKKKRPVELESWRVFMWSRYEEREEKKKEEYMFYSSCELAKKKNWGFHSAHKLFCWQHVWKCLLYKVALINVPAP